MSDVNFFQTNLDNADLSGANLTGAYLTSMSAIAANFNSAQLDQSLIYLSDFTDASLYETRFGRAFVERTQFVNTLMIGADLSDATLVSVNFEGALLCGADIAYGDYRYGCVSGQSDEAGIE